MSEVRDILVLSVWHLPKNVCTDMLCSLLEDPSRQFAYGNWAFYFSMECDWLELPREVCSLLLGVQAYYPNVSEVKLTTGIEIDPRFVNYRETWK